MSRKSLFDRDNIELFILTPEEEAEIKDLLATDESIEEPEDLFLTEEFKSLSTWKRFYLRLKVALATYLQVW
jgi:hypothetical protein